MAIRGASTSFTSAFASVAYKWSSRMLQGVSRMLALQCVTADQDAIPTMIFDEIDTGVSGKAAQKIGMKLREVSKNHQVLCVTHLAQIAVMGEHHFMIEKKVQDGRTQTFVQPLDAAGRIAEIARIMGGESPSSLLLKTAQEELQKWRNLL